VFLIDGKTISGGLSRKKIPRRSGGFVVAFCSTQQQDQDDQRNRNSDEPEQDGHVTFLSGNGY
jgi:hypothetical protein